jgi:hypothetical protein
VNINNEVIRLNTQRFPQFLERGEAPCIIEFMDNGNVMIEPDEFSEFLLNHEIDPRFWPGSLTQNPQEGRGENYVPDGT